LGACAALGLACVGSVTRGMVCGSACCMEAMQRRRFLLHACGLLVYLSLATVQLRGLSAGLPQDRQLNKPIGEEPQLPGLRVPTAAWINKPKTEEVAH